MWEQNWNLQPNLELTKLYFECKFQWLKHLSIRSSVTPGSAGYFLTSPGLYPKPNVALYYGSKHYHSNRTTNPFDHRMNGSLRASLHCFGLTFPQTRGPKKAPAQHRPQHNRAARFSHFGVEKIGNLSLTCHLIVAHSVFYFYDLKTAICERVILLLWIDIFGNHCIKRWYLRGRNGSYIFFIPIPNRNVCFSKIKFNPHLSFPYHVSVVQEMAEIYLIFILSKSQRTNSFLNRTTVSCLL